MYKGRFYLYTSSHLDALANLYAEHRRRHPQRFRPADILAGETIVVPTKGVAVWLEHYLCQERAFVMANVRFPFIRNQIDDLLRLYLATAAEKPFEAYNIPRMTWDIMSLLQKHLEQYLELREYLDAAFTQEKCPQLRNYQLAMRIAQLFDQYLIYRPELLLQWYQQPEKHSHWQAIMWRQLRQQADTPSPAEAMLQFCQAQLQPAPFYPISIFGSSVMPPIFLRIFKKLSTVVPVHFFYLNPCEEYWADQKSKWQRQDPGLTETHFSNPLLGNLGMQGQEFFREVLQLDEIIEIEPLPGEGYQGFTWAEDDKEPELDLANRTILQRLQHDIRKQVSPKITDSPVPIAANDDSLTIHSCHYDLRQVEVLHNHILALLQKHPYALNDILIMAPDISRFSTLIQAVFDQGPLAQHYAFSDRSISQDNLLAEAFLGILALCQSRFSVSQVLQLLDSQALRDCFGFQSEDLSKIRSWLTSARVHWGRDANEREKLYSKAFANFSWRQGLDRLLLGLAIDDDPDAPPLFAELLLPLSQANGKENRLLLEKLCCFIDALFATAESYPDSGLTAQEWFAKLTAILETFFLANADNAYDYGVMYNTIRTFYQNLQQSSYAEQKIILPVVSGILAEALQSTQETAGFLAGRITCCSLLPMRSIPCKVIALLGLEEDSYPRQENPLGFSIIAQEGRLLDRKRPWEDRFIFLETLLSAQDYLLLYYHGQGEFDQKEHIPSTVISEVLEYLQLTTAETMPELSDKIIIRHPLHSFSSNCFPLASARLFSSDTCKGMLRQVFSYDHSAWKVAKSSIRKHQETPAKVVNSPSWPAELWPIYPKKHYPDNFLQVSLHELENCLIDASEFYATRSLGLPGKEWSEAGLADSEDYSLDRLEQITLLRELVEKKIPYATEHPQYQQEYQRLLADNRLPVGEFGELSYAELIGLGTFQDGKFKHEWQQQQRFSGSLTISEVGTALPESLSDDPYFGPLQQSQKEEFLTLELSGQFLARENNAGVLYCSFKKETGSRHLLRFYLRHLFLAALQGESCQSYLRNDNDQTGMCLSQLSREQAQQYLRRLLQVYLNAARRPLPLFEYSSLAAVTIGAPRAFANFPIAVNKKSSTVFSDNDVEYNQYVRTFWGNDFPMAIAGPMAWYCYAPLMAKTIFNKLRKTSAADYPVLFFQPCDLQTCTTKED